MKSICEDCEHKRSTWSDELAEDGYIGCVVGYNDPSRIYQIEAEIVATGWIKLGMMTNNQIITKGTTYCPYKNQNLRLGGVCERY